MLRREPNVRVSIVVPHLGDDVAFEETLVSVLENRPSDSEVCVVHDGHYSDPFDLGDEVRFVTHDVDSLPMLIAAAARVANGRFVHVIGAGVRSTDGWTHGALEKFEHDDVAMVAPVARASVNGSITTAGWTSGTSSLEQPIAPGRKTLGRRDAASIQGVCLTASFWRRDALRSVCEAMPTANAHAAQFAWPRLLCQQGWRCALAEESTVIASPSMLGMEPSRSRGTTIRAIESSLQEESFVRASMSVGMTALCNMIRPRVWGEVAGEALSLVIGSKETRRIQSDAVHGPEEIVESIRLPYPVAAQAVRRAA